MLIGIDEVGRGAWAGPMVVVGLFFFDQYQWERLARRHDKTYWRLLEDPTIVIADSKILSKRQRERTCKWLEHHATYQLLIGSVDEINREGIRVVWDRCVKQIVMDFFQKTDQEIMVIIDGNWLPEKLRNKQVVCEIKAESKFIEVAAASIVAKVRRDQMLVALSESNPAYGWETNAGYGTPKHQDAIIAHGRTLHHRDLWLRKLAQKNTSL